MENKANENIKYGFFGKKFPVILIGLILLVLAILPFFNSNGLSSLLLYCASYVLGSFSFLFLSLQAIFGIYLMFKMEFPKVKASFTYLGLILLFISGCICSSIHVEELSFTNFVDMYNSNFSNILESSIRINSLGDVCKLSGGFIGYFFSSLFVTGLGKIATSVFAGLFLFIGVIICIRKPLGAFYAFIKSICEAKARKRQEKKNNQKEKEELKIQQPNEASPSPFSSSTSSNDFSNGFTIRQENQPSQDNKTNKQQHNFFTPNNEQETDFVKQDNEPINNSSPFSGFTSFNNVNVNSSNETRPQEEIKQEPHFENKEVTQEETKIQQTPFENSNPTPSYSTSSVFTSSNDNTKEESKTDNNFVSEENSQAKNEYQFNNTEPSQETVKQETHSQENKNVSPFSNNVSNKQTSESVTPPPMQSLHKTMKVTRYTLPSADLLTTQNDVSKYNINVEADETKKEIINEVFRKLKIRASVRDYTIGPSVTRFNIIREDGVKVSEIAKNDVLSELQIDLGGDMSVRIEPVVKGETTSGIEISNPAPMMVSYKECFNSVSPNEAKTIIPLGKDISNKVVKVAIDDLPHLLVSGTTGSGKSVFIHSIIMTLIMRNYPDELKLILVDPKMVEFSKYRDMPHLFCPVVTNIAQAVSMLKKLCEEMDRRFQIFATFGAANINEYNTLRKDKNNLEIIPRVVCIIDEFADMMGQDPKNVESYTQRLAQKARACGIYLIIATQRPSVNCITGTIKANIPARIALMLPSTTDSMTILGEGGAEALIGKGDLLAKIPSLKATIRVQSAFVKNEDIIQVVSYLKQQCGAPYYDENFLNFTKGEEVTGKLDEHRGLGGFEDELYQTCKDYVISSRVASTSNLQRRFNIGYSRAASILDALEADGVIKTVANNRKEVIAPKPEDGEVN